MYKNKPSLTYIFYKHFIHFNLIDKIDKYLKNNKFVLCHVIDRSSKYNNSYSIENYKTIHFFFNNEDEQKSYCNILFDFLENELLNLCDKLDRIKELKKPNPFNIIITNDNKITFIDFVYLNLSLKIFYNEVGKFIVEYNINDKDSFVFFSKQKLFNFCDKNMNGNYNYILSFLFFILNSLSELSSKYLIE